MGLGDKTRERMLDLLEDRLVDLMDLMLRVEWEQGNLQEPSFTSLRELFDKVWDDSKAFGERMASRMAELGGGVQESRVTLAGLRKRAELPWYPPSSSGVQEQVSALSGRLSDFRRQARLSMEAADEAGDGKTADLFRKVVHGFDRYLWLADAARPER